MKAPSALCPLFLFTLLQFFHRPALIQFKVGFYSDHPNPFSLSSEELIQILQERNESPKLIGMIDSLLQKFDDFEFARNEESRPNLIEEYKNALSIIKRIK